MEPNRRLVRLTDMDHYEATQSIGDQIGLQALTELEPVDVPADIEARLAAVIDRHTPPAL